MFKFLTATTLFASLVVSSLPLSAQGISQIDPQAWPADSSGVTRTIVGDTLLVECHPETVVPKRRHVAAKPRSGVKAGKVTHVRRKVRKSPGATTIQVCKETRLPQKPAPKKTMVAPPAEALGPIERPQVASAAGMLPPVAPSAVVGGGHMFRGGAMAGVPLVFLAFLHHGNDNDNGLVPQVPTLPPIDTEPTPPITSTPEPSGVALLASGLVGLGTVVRRRRR